MKKRNYVLLFLILLMAFFPHFVLAINVSARNAVMLDLDSGRILYQKNANDPHLVASITNIMTT